MSNPDSTNVPLPTRSEKFGKQDSGGANLFGFSETEDNYWYLSYRRLRFDTLHYLCTVQYMYIRDFYGIGVNVKYSNSFLLQLHVHNKALEDSADCLFDSLQALGPEGGILPPNISKEVLIKIGLGKLRQIWNLSDIDRDGYLDHHKYVVAMFLCDAVIQKKKPIPS